ncbi:MAG TPA: hypothetical protein VF605_03280 [Allosphingosinicella sp.]|jgi:hypothetical protein
MEDIHRAADVRHYTQLETGARWLAARVAPGAERNGHLAHAERYSRLRFDAEGC